MRVSAIKLLNWRNFLEVDVALKRRAFLVGPNASGKSNFLDALRFLRDVADVQGGFQRAIEVRDGVSQIRSLHARRHPGVAIETELDLGPDQRWSYRLEFAQNQSRRALVQREIVHLNGKCVLERPDADDTQDPQRMTQTHLEQVSANKNFRAIAEFFAQIRYLHLVPQLVREPDRSVGRSRDPYGGDFLEQIARTPPRVQTARLHRIEAALRVAVPQLKELKLERDNRGVPHLRGLYEHWRMNAGWQNEGQLSDGTLRLLGLLWSLLDGDAPLLLEEPELSLHAEVVRHIPSMFARLTRKTGRQIVVSTHSAELLSDQGIAPEEVLLLTPSKEGTAISLARDDRQIVSLLEGGSSMADAVLPKTAPADAGQLSLFE
ncbi:MAG: AAA family ATPase [Candidatus Binataceae bacterium]